MSYSTADNIHRRNFPDGFVFGTATSAYQIEGAACQGGRGCSIWDTFTHRFPDMIEDGKNGNVAIDSYNRVKEDVQLMKKIGLDAYRFSISWPRLLPTGRLCGGVNKQGIDYYNTLIDELIKNDIQPYATLFHWDLPQALEDEYGGFLDHSVRGINNKVVYGEKIVPDFREFADLCFWEFGDRVKHWITFNETWSYAVAGYVNGTFPPGRGASTPETVKSLPALGRFGSRITRLLCDAKIAESRGVTIESLTQGNPGTEPYIVTHNQLLCHADVVSLYRDKYQTCQKGKIGIALVAIYTEPLDENDPEDEKAAIRSREFMFGWLMHPVKFGDYPSSMRENVRDRLPNFSELEKKMLKDSFDFVGLNYYTANYATALKDDVFTPDYNTDSRVKLETTRNGIPIGEKPGADWLYVYPQGIYKLLMYIKNTYHNPTIYITENGVNELDNITLTLPICTNDQFRIDYFNKHLCYIRDACYDGVDVRGYFAWSLMDNFEWADGYTVRFGMIYIDYNKELARLPKESAKWFMKFLKKEDSTPSKKRALVSTPDGPAKALKKY